MSEDKSMPKKIIGLTVAHDYVRFRNNWSGEEVTIGIQAMIDVVLPYLNAHQSLTEEHLESNRERKGYNFSADTVKVYNEEKKMYEFMVFVPSQQRYETISHNGFNVLKSHLKYANDLANKKAEQEVIE
jgi:hypothetical protein